MPGSPLSGKSLRLTRLSRFADDRFLFVPMDHSVSAGPIADIVGFNELVRAVATGGADGIVMHKGRARSIDPRVLRNCSLVIHLSASTVHARDTDAKVLVGGVQEAIRTGADAVSVHVNIGSDTEAQQLRDMGTVAAACDRWGMPLLAMVYPRGPRIAEPGAPALLAHAVNIAADLGADLVKTGWAGSVERMSEVVASSPIPIIVAGGPAGNSDLTDFACSVMSSGCHGLAIGRRVFRSSAPQLAVRQLAAVVHRSWCDSPAGSATQPTLVGAL